METEERELAVLDEGTENMDVLNTCCQGGAGSARS